MTPFPSDSLSLSLSLSLNLTPLSHPPLFSPLQLERQKWEKEECSSTLCEDRSKERGSAGEKVRDKEREREREMRETQRRGGEERIGGGLS